MSHPRSTLQSRRLWMGTWVLALVLLVLTSPSVAGGSSGHQVHVVYMGAKSDKHESEIIADHHQLLASVVGSIEDAKESILYHYLRSFRGFAAKLAPHHVQALRASDGVVSVFKSRSVKPATTNSWDFLEVYGPRAVASGHASAFPSLGVQSDIVIGVFDTGRRAPTQDS